MSCKIHQRAIRFIMICVFIISIGVLVSNTASAQYSKRAWEEYELYERVTKRQMRSKFVYETWFMKIEEYKNAPTGQFPFFTFLEAYSYGPDYDPYAKVTIDKLYDYAYAVNVANGDEARNAAIAFKGLLNAHLANLDVVNAAIALVRQNPLLADMTILEWARRGLQQRVLGSGNGAVLSKAYDIYTIGEEALVLKHHNARLIDTEVISDGLSYYHVHLVEDINTGKPSKIYMRLTTIMQHITEINRLKNLDYNYPLPVPENFTGE